MKTLAWNKLGLVACCLVCACAAIATMNMSTVALTRRMARSCESNRVSVADAPGQTCSALPEAGGRRIEESTPDQQAAAGNLVVARSLIQALDQAVSSNNTKAVDDILKGLPKYGAAARQAVQEGLDSTKNQRARDVLLKALAQLNS